MRKATTSPHPPPPNPWPKLQLASLLAKDFFLSLMTHRTEPSPPLRPPGTPISIDPPPREPPPPKRNQGSPGLEGHPRPGNALHTHAMEYGFEPRSRLACHGAVAFVLLGCKSNRSNGGCRLYPNGPRNIR